MRKIMNNFCVRVLKAIVIFIVFFNTSYQLKGQSFPYQDPDMTTDERVKDLVLRMSMEEKIRLVAGMKDKQNPWSTETDHYDGTLPNERLNIPPYFVIHGPMGINTYRDIQLNGDFTFKHKAGTYFGTSIAMAQTWNTPLVQQATQVMGEEVRAAGGHSNAGPAMNIIRDLKGGRSPEYFTEDPYLNGKMAAAYVKGLQSNKGIAILKHFVCNNQELYRTGLNVKVSERALREIYLPGFKTAIQEGGALALMTGYNKVNGEYCSENKHLLIDILRKDWGFKGMVMSDWTGTHSTIKMANSGMDLEMPYADYFDKKLIQAVIDKTVDKTTIDKMVSHILYTFFEAGLFDEYLPVNLEKIADPKHIPLAKKVSDESIVLLKNEDILPLDPSEIKTIGVIGPNGDFGGHFRNGEKNYQLYAMGGSSTIAVDDSLLITPFEGIKNSVNGKIKVAFSPGAFAENGCGIINPKLITNRLGESGFYAEYFPNDRFEGKPVIKNDHKIQFWWSKPPVIEEANNRKSGSNKDRFSIRWTGSFDVKEDRYFFFELQATGELKLYIDDQLVVGDGPEVGTWNWVNTGGIDLKKGTHQLRIEYAKKQWNGHCVVKWDLENDYFLKEAIKLAEKSDVVIMPVGTSGLLETETRDRNYVTLSPAQERLVETIASMHKKVIVVTYSAGIAMGKWMDKAPAILQAAFPGQEGGNALADIIWGKVNPSAKLTVTLPKSYAQYPKNFYATSQEIEYKEGIFVGYRYFEKEKLTPAFPFGHGLSYTNFKYSNLKVKKKFKPNKPLKVSFQVTNTGKVEGKEVVQLYIHDQISGLVRPKKELKRFKKIKLLPGESKTIIFNLNQEDFSYFDPDAALWKSESGAFDILIGASSKDIRLKTTSILKY